MRVLFVSQELPPETGWGGIGTYVDVLSKAVASRGVEVHVLSVVDGQPASSTETMGVTVHRRPLRQVRGAERLPPETWRRLWLATTVARLIRRLGLRPSVVECPEWGAEGLALALRGSLPLVVRLHSSARQLFPYTNQGREWRGLDGRMSAWLEELSARRANVVVSTRSNLDAVAASLRLDERALHAIPYPVRLPPPQPMAVDGPPRVTFVGRLEPRKAPDVVLAAAPKVLAAVPDARFVFVGRDAIAPGTRPSTAWLRREAERLGVAHAIELTGQLDSDGVADQLLRATVCAFPSRWESFGNVVAEASATGRPVVASAIPPFEELVADGETGRIVPPEDVDAWAEALIELLTDGERAGAMGKAGANRVAGIAEPGRVADLALAAYEHAIERFRRGERAARR
jgi:glycosyltransferase involved in cell wall biosynthesis